MKNSKLVGVSLALLISVGVISGCSETMPNMASNASANNAQSGTQTQSQSKSSATVSSESGTVVASGQTSTSTTSSSTTNAKSSSVEAKDAMTSYNDDEATFADSESIANDNFSTKSFSTKGVLGKIATAIGVRAKVRKDLVDSGAVAVNAEGTITVDSAKFAAEKNKLKVKLKAVKEVIKEKVKKLKRKDNIVKTSETNTVDNGDGTKTETITVQFKNEKLNIIRENIVSKTTNTADGKLVSSDHSLTVTYKEYSKVSTRLVTIDQTTGAKKVITDSTTTWKNGKKRVIHEERNLDASGNGTGIGTIVVTTKDGQTKTYNLNATITGSIAVNSSATDTATKTEVKVETGADATTTETVIVNGQAQASEEVNLDTSVAASADANVTTDSATVSADATTATSASL